MIRAILAAAVFGLTAGAVQAQAYRWVDEQGRVRYSDTPPPATAKDARKLQLRPSAPAGDDARGAPAAGGKPKPAAQPEITLYTNSGCAQLCSDARSHLQARSANFREIEVESADSLEELRKVSGGMSVPVLSVGTAIQKGYEPVGYDRLLDSAGLPKRSPARAAAPR